MNKVTSASSASQLNKSALANLEAGTYDVLVFCHLRWDFVYQRPQHLISRLASKFKILMIEEPVGFEEGEESQANIIEINPQLHILQPKVNAIEDIAALIPKYVTNTQIDIGWFYSAAFSPLIKKLNFNTIVYDCMDELSLFKGASQVLITQEQYLLQQADVVFTGGKSLYEVKKKMHDKVFCFPSSVDEMHFAQAKNDIAIPEDILSIKTPIVGYFGVIDERIDLELIKNTAASLPQISFVMIGPLAKISDADLPRLPNIHYLGMKSYNELPHYLKAFDIAMMPFSLNDATKYISPTKTLEYMAAGKPIISTRIKDVARDYSRCVKIIENADDFCAAIVATIESQASYDSDYDEILSNTSWDTTAKRMKSIIQEVEK